MPQTESAAVAVAADAFGVATVALAALFALFGLFCVVQSVYFRLRIRKLGSLPLGFFSASLAARVVLILVMVWWGLWEVLRLTIVNSRAFVGSARQRNICRAYVVSNLGFAEPGTFLVLACLLHGTVRKMDLNFGWSMKAVGRAFLLCTPVLLLQALLVYVAPKFDADIHVAKYFTRTSFKVDGREVCAYPLFGTALLGLVDAILICYISYIGCRVLAAVINKGLRRRLSYLVMSVLALLPTRVLLLGFSVLPRLGGTEHEAIVFAAFSAMLLCMSVVILTVGYYPIADSLAIDGLGQSGIGRRLEPYSDYYYDDASLLANQSFHDIEGPSYSLDIMLPPPGPSQPPSKPMLPFVSIL